MAGDYQNRSYLSAKEAARAPAKIFVDWNLYIVYTDLDLSKK